MSNCKYPLNRFNKPSKQLLVEMINTFNGTTLVADQLIFSAPEALQGDGKTSVTVKFRDNLGWSLESRPMTYYRIEANRHEQLKSLVIHAEYLGDAAALLAVIFDQTGVLLEADEIVVQEIYGGLLADQSDINVRATQPYLTGFDEVVDPLVVPDQDLDRNFKITFKDSHLIFFGHLYVMVRPALKLLSNTIARRMDFRDFYMDGSYARPPVDLYIPQGRLLLADGQMSVLGGVKETGAYLYEQKAGPINALGSRVADVLVSLTGDLWHYSSELVLDFNIYNSTVLYNGLVTPEYSADDSRYSYVMVIELGSLCRNLSGNLRIGYRYSAPGVPTNRQYNPASATPIFQY